MEGNRCDCKALINLQESQSMFPFSGIFSPDGFLSKINNSKNSSSSIEDQDSDPENSASSSSTERCPKYCNSLNCDDDGPGTDCEGKQRRALAGFSEIQLLTPSESDHQESSQSDGDCDLLPSEAAFGIDHILEKILASLEPSDLLTCRHVCHRWLSITTPFLQKSVKITFVDNILRTRIKTPFCPTLKGLSDLLQLNFKTLSTGFPCNRFTFVSYQTEESIAGEEFQNFLNTGGSHLRELSVKFKPSVNETQAIQLVQKLITEQAPNLHYLSLDLAMEMKFESDGVIENNQHNLNTSLKIFQLGFEPSSKLLKMVLEATPNLKELILDKYEYNYFTEPRNRVHLLKKVHLDPLIMEIDPLERIAIASSGSFLKLVEISICHWDWFCWGDGKILPDQEKKVIFVMNELFHSSWDTLETIDWSGMVFLKGMKWPKVMPKVKTVNLQTANNLYSKNVKVNVQSFFPSGFSLPTTFPKLETICFYDYKGYDNLQKYLKDLNFQRGAAGTVKNIYIDTCCNDSEVSVEELKLVQEYFPGAEIHAQSGDLDCFL